MGIAKICSFGDILALAEILDWTQLEFPVENGDLVRDHAFLALVLFCGGVGSE